MKELKLNIQKKYFFKYLVIDNLFTASDFDDITKRIKNIKAFPSDKLQEISWIRVFKDNQTKVIIDSDCISEKKILEIKKNYSTFFYKMLAELCPLKSDLVDFIDFELSVTGKDFVYEIHDDVPYKLLSIVIYLLPEENMGTILYSCPRYRLFDGKLASPKEGTIINWKPNRALIFSRIAQKTWHSYQGDGKENRLAFIINIGTNKIEKVKEIENSDEFKKSITWVN